MPDGKPAGVPCIHLDDQMQCKIFNHPDRPKVCSQFKPEPIICGRSAEEAMKCLTELEES